MRLEQGDKKEDQEMKKHIKIMKQTSKYLQTPSFKTIYGGGNAIKWIEQAVADDLLLSRNDILLLNCFINWELVSDSRFSPKK